MVYKGGQVKMAGISRRGRMAAALFGNLPYTSYISYASYASHKYMNSKCGGRSNHTFTKNLTLASTLSHNYWLTKEVSQMSKPCRIPNSFNNCSFTVKDSLGCDWLGQNVETSCNVPTNLFCPNKQFVRGSQKVSSPFQYKILRGPLMQARA